MGGYTGEAAYPGNYTACSVSNTGTTSPLWLYPTGLRVCDNNAAARRDAAADSGECAAIKGDGAGGPGHYAATGASRPASSPLGYYNAGVHADGPCRKTVGAAKKHKTDRESMLDFVKQNGSEEHKANKELMLTEARRSTASTLSLIPTSQTPWYSLTEVRQRVARRSTASTLSSDEHQPGGSTKGKNLKIFTGLSPPVPNSAHVGSLVLGKG